MPRKPFACTVPCCRPGQRREVGALLARLLLGKGCTVFGTSRDAQGRVTLLSMAPDDFRDVLMAIRRSQPAETIQGYTLQAFVEEAFCRLGLDWSSQLDMPLVVDRMIGHRLA